MESNLNPVSQFFGPASASLPGTCGELVQGTLEDIACLVSCPIDRTSRAEVRLHAAAPGWDSPQNSPKTMAALRTGLCYLDSSMVGGRLTLVSDLPRGRGYASSTADVGAALYALGQAIGRPFSASEVAQLAVSVEPSDSTIFPGLCLLAHRDNSFHECLGEAPQLDVLVLDPGGKVDTLAFNRQDHRHQLRRAAPDHREAFDLLRIGLKKKDWPTLGAAATLSARIHQSILVNPLLEAALPLAVTVGALGVCRAHSGTLVGLLLDARQCDVCSILSFVSARLEGRAAVYHHHFVSGGARFLQTGEKGMHPETLQKEGDFLCLQA